MKHVYVVVEVDLGGDQEFLGVYPTSEDAQQALYEGDLYNHLSAEIIEAPLGGGEFRGLSHPSGRWPRRNGQQLFAEEPSGPSTPTPSGPLGR